MTYDSEELYNLGERLIEENITPEEFARLKEMLKDDKNALEAHVDYLFNHAALAALASEENSGPMAVDMRISESTGDMEPGTQNVSVSFSAHTVSGAARMRPSRFLATSALVAFICVAGTLGLLGLSGFFSGPCEFVTIAQTTNCLWNDSSVVTSPGTRIGSCTLNLEKGIALLHFDNGVVVSLEGPCVYEIKDSKYTILHSGSLVATVDTKEGNGFVIDTPHAAIKDFGTKFGVQTSQKRPTSVFVIEGNVEVLPRDAQNVISLFKGESIAVEAVGDSSASESELLVSPSQIETLQYSTAYGRGNEAWVVNMLHTIETANRQFPGGISDPYMLVKLSREDDVKSDRKAIFRIDLGTFAKKEDILGATIHLSYGPTGIGYATYISDTNFTVYGLVDEKCDHWGEMNLDWDQLPGNAPRSKMLSSAWKPLGNFSIRRGNPSGTIQLKSDALCDFIRDDTNNLLSFAIVCETPAEETFGLVFGFANRNHSTMSPPRLNITLKKKLEKTVILPESEEKLANLPDSEFDR